MYSWRDPHVERAEKERVGGSVKGLPTVERGTWENSGKDWQLKVEPGLSSFGPHPSDIAAYLQPLFHHARSIIPSEALAQTPVYVLATAGMRLLPDEQRSAVLKETCNYIQHQTQFKLSQGGCDEHVQVITGEEEGLLGWIAINYLMDGFHFQSTPSTATAVDGTKGRSTYGFLDMGGASTQIAFEPSSKAQQGSGASSADGELTPVTLRMLDGTSVVHNVFVTTFLGFGTNKARERYLQALSTLAAPSATTLADPCLPSGLHLDAGPTAKTPSAKLIGTGSFDKCLASLAPLLDKDAACSQPPCLFHGVHVPAIDFSVNHFIGVSEYWFSSNDVYQLGGVYDYVSFQKAAQAFCGRSWPELEADLKSGTVYGKQVNEDRLELQCFKSAWMATVLHDGIGLPRIIDSGGKGDGKQHADTAQDKADEKNLFQSVNDVKGLSVSWTLGKAVLEASKDITPQPAAETHKGTAEVGLPDAAVGSDVGSEIESHVGALPNGPSWQETLSNSQHALLDNAQYRISGLSMLAIAVLVMASLAVCCLLRGRGSKAKRRRALLQEYARAPCGRRRGGGGGGGGDYTTLNSMEEGSHDMDTLESEGRANGRKHESSSDFAIGGGSDTSDDVRDDYGGKDKRRRSSGTVMTALLVPLQRVALALGIKSAATVGTARHGGMTGSSRGHTRRLTNSKRLPMRHHALATPISLSQPTSPHSHAFGSAISRPGSRADSVLSPRVRDGSSASSSSDSPSYFALWQQQPQQQPQQQQQMGHASGSNGGRGTTSARSSRAASPSLGASAIAKANSGSGGGRWPGSSLSPSCRSGSSTPTSFQTGGVLPLTGRLTPQRLATGYSRKAWEED